MQLHPGTSAVHLLRAAIIVLIVGLFLSQPAVVAWGGAIIVGLYLARTVTLTSVTQIRSAGFEMLWQTSSRYVRAQRGNPTQMLAEVRNRDERAVRFMALQSVHSPSVLVEVSPQSGEVPAGGRLLVTLTITPRRVGRHALHGLSLQVRGSPGLHEVPLSFPNPLGLLVMPPAHAMLPRSPAGGRSRSLSPLGLTYRMRGGDYDLRELRNYHPGDPLKRIAWRASAKRGSLVTKEFDNSERELVWIVLDASSELWSGLPGQAPLDLAIDAVARLATSHLRVGDKVGLIVLAAELLQEVALAGDAQQANRVHEALVLDTHTYDVRRSAWDDNQVAVRVMEHLRPLDATLAREASENSLEHLAKSADQTRSKRAPFAVLSPKGHHRADSTLRRYLASFGIESPPRIEPERPDTDKRLLEVLDKLLRKRPRPTRIVVASPLPVPRDRPDLVQGLGRLPKRHSRLEWLVVPDNAGAEVPETVAAHLAHQASGLHHRLRSAEGFDALRSLRIKPLRLVEHDGNTNQSPPRTNVLRTTQDRASSLVSH